MIWYEKILWANWSPISIHTLTEMWTREARILSHLAMRLEKTRLAVGGVGTTTHQSHMWTDVWWADTSTMQRAPISEAPTPPKRWRSPPASVTNEFLGLPSWKLHSNLPPYFTTLYLFLFRYLSESLFLTTRKGEARIILNAKFCPEKPISRHKPNAFYRGTQKPPTGLLYWTWLCQNSWQIHSLITKAIFLNQLGVKHQNCNSRNYLTSPQISFLYKLKY